MKDGKLFIVAGILLIVGFALVKAKKPSELWAEIKGQPTWQIV